MDIVEPHRLRTQLGGEGLKFKDWHAAVALVLSTFVTVEHLGAEERSPVESSSRVLLERAKELRDKSATFTQDEALQSLQPLAANGFYYRFDDHLHDAVVTGSGAPPVDRVGGGYRFEFDGNDPVKMTPQKSRHEIRDGRIHIRQRKNDPLLSGPGLRIDTESIGTIALRMKVESGHRAVLKWSRKFRPKFDSNGELDITLLPDGEFHTYVLDASTVLRKGVPFGESIMALALIPSDESGDRVEIDYLRLIPKRQKYGQVVIGRASETLNGEMRSVMHIRSPARARYSVTLPSGPVRLRFGAGVLDNDDPTKFQVAITARGETEVVSKLIVTSNEGWIDREVDLSRWAGKQVQIEFSNHSSSGNIAYWSSPVLRSPPKKRFNVILYLEDTLRADHLSVYGYALDTSPNKVRFASEGVLFRHAFSQAPMTRPSVPSLMTSLVPSASGVWSDHQRLDERQVTLAEILRHQGFATALVSENPNAGPGAGLHQGFDYFWHADQRSSNLHGFAYRFLKEHRDRNFFLYVHRINPHATYEPSEPYRRFWQDSPGVTPVKRTRLDADFVVKPTAEGRRLLYDGEIAENDDLFAEFLDKLAQMGLENDTLVVNLSDHGEHLGERGIWGHHSPGYIQVLRVPLIMRHPTLLPAGQRFDETVQLLDVTPTILELAGIDRTPFLFLGDSLISLIKGEDPKYWKQRVTISEEPIDSKFLTDDVSASVFQGSRHYLSSAEIKSPIAFDFHRDPNELTPLSARETKKLGSVLDPMLKELKRVNSELRRNVIGDSGALIELIPKDQERLRALGYIE